MPVSPLDYPSFKGGAASYQAGAQKGVDLTGAGLELDDSVLRCTTAPPSCSPACSSSATAPRKLSTGLNETAAPGADELAAGLNKAHAG